MCELGLKLQKREVGYCGRYSEWGGSSVCLRCRLDGKGGGCEASVRSRHRCGAGGSGCGREISFEISSLRKNLVTNSIFA